MEISGTEGLQKRSTWWSQLPDNLKEHVLAWLPVEGLCKYCLVCKEWNALLSSTQFITNVWLAAPPNQKPWLVLFDDFFSSTASLNCMAYCFFTHTWKRLSLDFLKKQYDDDDLFEGEASAAGLFLVNIWSSNVRNLLKIVYNPLTGKSIELPRIKHGLICAMTITADEGHGDNGNTYKAIAIVDSGDEERVEIYDSSLKSWSTAGHVPQKFRAWSRIRTEKIVVSEDFLYWMSLDENSSTLGIVAFSIQNGTFVFTPLTFEHRYGVLFTCGSRVLLGSCISDTGAIDTRGIIILELENSHSSMARVTEIARMPPCIFDAVFRNGNVIFDLESLTVDFEATRNLVCIRDRCGNEVLVYNLGQNTWTWLPRCPWLQRCPGPICWHGFRGSFVFEPRPDMDVE